MVTVRWVISPPHPVTFVRVASATPPLASNRFSALPPAQRPPGRPVRPVCGACELFDRLAPAEPAEGSTYPCSWMPSGTQDGLRSRGWLTTRRSAAAPPWGPLRRPPRPPPRLRRRQDEGQRSGPHLVRMEHDDSGLDGERATAAAPVSDPHQYDTPAVTDHLGVGLVHLGLAPGDSNRPIGHHDDLTGPICDQLAPGLLGPAPDERNLAIRHDDDRTGPISDQLGPDLPADKRAARIGELDGPEAPTKLEPSRCSHTVKRAGVTRRRPPGSTRTVMIWWRTPRVPVTGPEGPVDTGCTRSDSCCSTHRLTAGGSPAKAVASRLSQTVGGPLTVTRAAWFDPSCAEAGRCDMPTATATTSTDIPMARTASMPMRTKRSLRLPIERRCTLTGSARTKAALSEFFTITLGVSRSGPVLTT